MGADITVSNEREVGGEPVADLLVRHANLRGIEIPEAQVPAGYRRVPRAVHCRRLRRGEDRAARCRELRVKESDRITAWPRG
jgi:5-enolpyruvylshikimate-3-phosphate synthase